LYAYSAETLPTIISVSLPVAEGYEPPPLTGSSFAEKLLGGVALLPTVASTISSALLPVAEGYEPPPLAGSSFPEKLLDRVVLRSAVVSTVVSASLSVAEGYEPPPSAGSSCGDRLRLRLWARAGFGTDVGAFERAASGVYSNYSNNASTLYEAFQELVSSGSTSVTCDQCPESHRLKDEAL
jgi:hypothetical protein